jgi:hypothetical protein
MSQWDKDNPHLADILHRATLERSNQDQRIADIFGTQTVPKVTEETLAIYLNYLKQHLEVPCQLTGIESLGCFSWEVSYIFGRRRPKEYVQRKQHQPSYTDTYTWLNFEDAYDPYDGLAVKVKRVSDSKRFVLPLANLKALEKPSNNDQLLDDYVIWFVNWRH